MASNWPPGSFCSAKSAFQAKSTSIPSVRSRFSRNARASGSSSTRRTRFLLGEEAEEVAAVTISSLFDCSNSPIASEVIRHQTKPHLGIGINTLLLKLGHLLTLVHAVVSQPRSHP